jgi:hypothetical protein
MQASLPDERLKNSLQSVESSVNLLAVTLAVLGAGSGIEGKLERLVEVYEVGKGVEGSGSWCGRREEGGEVGDAREGRIGSGLLAGGRSGLAQLPCEGFDCHGDEVEGNHFPPSTFDQALSSTPRAFLTHNLKAHETTFERSLDLCAYAAVPSAPVDFLLLPPHLHQCNCSTRSCASLAGGGALQDSRERR